MQLHVVPRDGDGAAITTARRPFTSSVNDGAHFVDVIINLRRAA